MRKLWQYDSAGMLQGCTGQDYFARHTIDGTQLIRRTRERENHGTCWHSIVAYVLTGCLPCPQFLACLSLPASHWFTKHFRSFHRPHHNVLHYGFPLPAKHYIPTAWSNQKQHKRFTSTMHETINQTTKQYLFLCIFPCYFSQIPILIPLNSKQLNER